MREIPGWGFYFWTYAACKDYWKLNDIWDRPHDHSYGQFMLLMHSGGLAGCASWGVSYPLDCVNSTIKSTTAPVYSDRKP